jgi:hypothetical protein
MKGYMKGSIKSLSALLIFAPLAACTTMPEGPNVTVLPGTGKSFDQFRADDFECRQFATSQLGGATASSNATDSGVRSAAIGTALGAVAGAAIGGSHGAGVGAGTGLLMGGLVGTGSAQQSAYSTQRRYDISYEQCMYAKGNRIPVAGQLETRRYHQGYYSEAPAYTSTPPAPNYMPPPPPQN